MVYHFTGDIIYTGITVILIMLGLELGRTFSPDLDIIANPHYKYGYYEFYLIKQTFGYIPYKIIFLWFWPYGKLISHRSWASHGFLIGSVVRLGYILLPFLALFFILFQKFGISWDKVYSFWPYFLYIFLGFFLADCLHLSLDY